MFRIYPYIVNDLLIFAHHYDYAYVSKQTKPKSAIHTYRLFFVCRHTTEYFSILICIYGKIDYQLFRADRTTLVYSGRTKKKKSDKLANFNPLIFFFILYIYLYFMYIKRWFSVCYVSFIKPH